MGSRVANYGFREMFKLRRILGPVTAKYGNVRASRASLEEAAGLLEAAVESKPGEWIYWYVLGDLYQPLAEFARSVRAAEKCYELRPEDPRSVYALATNLRTLTHARYVGDSARIEARGKLDTQLLASGYAAAFEPEASQRALQELGMTLNEAEQRCLLLFEKVLRLGVPEADVQHVAETLVAMYSELTAPRQGGQLRDLEDRLLLGSPRTRAALDCCKRGISLGQVGRLDDSIDLLREAVEIEPDYAEGHYNLGIALRSKGIFDEAVGEYREALRIRPGFVQAGLNLGAALGAEARWDEAIESYREVLRLQPDFVLARVNLGLALHHQGAGDEAVEEFTRALDIDPEDGLAHLSLGDALRAKGLLDDAIREYREALRVEPDLRFALTLAGALAEKGLV